jgi:hypothetical protein
MSFVAPLVDFAPILEIRVSIPYNGCKIWPLVLREEHGLRVFENRPAVWNSAIWRTVEITSSSSYISLQIPVISYLTNKHSPEHTFLKRPKPVLPLT